MNQPDEGQWRRVEELAGQLEHLSPNEIASQVSRLAAAGESPTILTLLGKWLALPPPVALLAVGSIVGGRYTLREKIGEGGMGSIWRAEQKLVGRDVALKMIHSTLVTPDLNARFVAEIALLGRLNHPGIVKIFDAGVHEQEDLPAIPFFTMELVDGMPLARWAASRRGNHGALLCLMAEVCEAVQNAHECRVVHRDLKPNNILVRSNGSPVVLDFGIARLAGAATADEAGLFSGTPQYAAPEQHLGRDHDFRSGESVDVYSAGVVLFEVLTGRKLFDFTRRLGLTEMRRAVVEGSVPRLANVMPDCPPLVEEIVSRALRREPADRFYSMAAFGRALNRAAALTSSVAPLPPAWKPEAGMVVPGTGWRLTEKIGQGGVGQVWLGLHNQLNERRVFKFCDTEEKSRTLKRELTLFRLLKERIGRNPHFVPLHEVSLEEPPWYLMMDYTDARDLQTWCAEWPGGMAVLSLEVRVEIVAQVAEALQAAHEAGILHRDIKPANLLVRGSEEKNLHVLIADFGIGQIVTEEVLRGGTRLGFTRTVSELQRSSLSGTMLYLAPEVLEGHPATARSDIYSLGIVLWQMLIGDLNTALDPAEWAARIDDPLLRGDLARCVAGLPERRWASAGEFAASLRALPARRDAEVRRAAELAARERAAYRRGILRTSTIALVVVAVISSLAWMALLQRKQAERARGQTALDQAASLPRADLTAGRRGRGLMLLESAVHTGTNKVALRSAGAAVLGMPDLTPITGGTSAPRSSPPELFLAGETCRALSDDGASLAVARDLDGVNGVVDLFDASTRRLRVTVQRKQFPWIPIAEAPLLRFSPGGATIAVGGAATSRHILLCDTTNGTVTSYLFHGSDPLSCAWHPGGRIFAAGCADGTVRVWDTASALSASHRAFASNQFDLPPALDLPANDTPLNVVRGHRGPVSFIAFSTHGRWLASLDTIGYLRILTGFSRAGLPGLPPPTKTHDSDIGGHRTEPRFAVETRLDRAEDILALVAVDDRVITHRRGGRSEEFRFVPGDLPAETHVAFGVTEMAWNRNATELCAITLTDAHWLAATTLETLFTAPGRNAIGVAHVAENDWVLPTDTHFVEQRIFEVEGKQQLTNRVALRLSEADKAQGARTKLAAARDGRLAVYHGRRIHFFFGQEEKTNATITAAVGGGNEREIFWNSAGTLLGTTVRVTNGLHLETWTTSTDFPPQCQPLAATELEADRVIPANRGQQCLGRSVRRGIFTFDAGTRVEMVVDDSVAARQKGAMAVTAAGDFLAMAADRNVIHLRKLPDAQVFAELHSQRPDALVNLCWDASGRHLAAITENGSVLVWNLAPWHEWLARQGLEK